MGFEASMWHGNPGFRAARTRRHYIPVKDRSRKRMTPLAHYFPVPATGTGETMKIRNSFGNTFSGTLGKSMTAAKNKNVNYAREYVIPDNPRSGLQQEHRNAFHAGKEVWNGPPAVAAGLLPGARQGGPPRGVRVQHLHGAIPVRGEGGGGPGDRDRPAVAAGDRGAPSGPGPRRPEGRAAPLLLPPER